MILAPTLLLNAGSGAIVRPTFSRDFAGEKTLNNGTGPAITFTRADATTCATFFDANGVLQTAAANVPRFDHDPATAGNPSRGLLIEEARTNSLRNSQAGGSANGVIGSGGALPTYWTSAAVAGISYEVIGVDTDSGFSYIDVKISGTNTSGTTGFPSVVFESNTQVSASLGQTWTHSFYAKIAAGSVSGFSSTSVQVIESTSGGSTLASSTTAISLTSSNARFSHTRTLTEATTARITGRFVSSVADGASIDLTLRIAAPQLEQGAFPTSYIPTTSAAVTRSADSAVVTPISSFYNASEGTLFAEATASTTNGVASGINQQTVATLLENNVGDILMALYRTNGATTAGWYIGTSGGASADITQAGFTAGTNARLVGAYKSDDFAISVNGASATTDTSGGLPSPTTLRIGRYGSASGYLNGHIRRIAYWPKRLSNALLQSLTA